MSGSGNTNLNVAIDLQLMRSNAEVTNEQEHELRQQTSNTIETQSQTHQPFMMTLPHGRSGGGGSNPNSNPSSNVGSGNVSANEDDIEMNISAELHKKMSDSQNRISSNHEMKEENRKSPSTPSSRSENRMSTTASHNRNKSKTRSFRKLTKARNKMMCLSLFLILGTVLTSMFLFLK